MLNTLAFHFVRTKRHFEAAGAAIQISICHVQHELSQGQLVTVAKVKVCCPHLIQTQKGAVKLKKKKEKEKGEIGNRMKDHLRLYPHAC